MGASRWRHLPLVTKAVAQHIVIIERTLTDGSLVQAERVSSPNPLVREDREPYRNCSKRSARDGHCADTALSHLVLLLASIGLDRGNELPTGTTHAHKADSQWRTRVAHRRNHQY
jgi:hypothetical protein